MPHELPELPYAYTALEPHFDARTMEIHHSKHHNAYVTNLNAALQGTGLEDKTLCEIISNLDAVPAEKRGAVRNKSKDINDALDATCVGVDLEHGVRWAVPPARLLSMLVTLLHLLTTAWASPKHVHQYLGIQQWFDLLCRCKLSVYELVYRFVGEIFVPVDIFDHDVIVWILYDDLFDDFRVSIFPALFVTKPNSCRTRV